MTAVDTSRRPPDVELDGAQEPPGRIRRSLDRVRRVGRGTHGGRSSSRGPLSPVASGLRWSLACLALIGVWVLLYAFVLSGVQEARTQATYYATMRQALAEATAPIGGVIEPGSPVFILTAPTAGLNDAVVVEGTTSSAMTSGPGHLASTVLPGQQGVSVILGRSVTFGAPFKSISTMQPGDTITVTTGQGVFTYHVDRVRYPGDPLPPPVGANTSRLTLVTEIASGWRSGWAPATTVYVDATMAGGQIQPAPPGRLASVALDAEPMAGDASSLVMLVLWLQAMIAVIALGVWGRARWGTWQTWLIACPLLLACLWGATQSAIVLLPNLI
ncbi:MAG: class E sortase [Actinomycetes bacterium]